MFKILLAETARTPYAFGDVITGRALYEGKLDLAAAIAMGARA